MNLELTMLDYEPSLAPYFRDLNLDWLNKYFYVEPIDEEILNNPQQYIIDKGGYIFFARVNEAIAGTFAFLKVSAGIYELGKMAVGERFQGKGFGNALMNFSLKKAGELGAAKVILYSNTILQPAIHLYKKYGFKEVPLGSSDYKRSNIKMERDLTPNPSPGGEGNLILNRSETDYGEKLNKNANPILFEYAREGRKGATDAERILWEELRGRRLNNLKFRRQHPIDKYIADFYYHEKSLVIELDGAIHERADMKQYDIARDKHLTTLNLRVLRITNQEVMDDVQSVLLKINRIANQ